MPQSDLKERKLDPEMIFTILFGIVVGAGLYQSFNWNSTARLFPAVISIAALLIVGLRLFARFVWPRNAPKEERIEDLVDLPVDDSVPAEEFVRLAGVVFLWVGAFLVATLLIGLNFTGPVFVLAFVTLYARRKLRQAVLLAAGAATILILFQVVLNIRIPEGILLQ